MANKKENAMRGVGLLDPLFTSFDEGINGGAITSCHGSEDGSVNDPFVGFGGGRGVEGGKVFQRLFELGFGLGGVAIFLSAGGAAEVFTSCPFTDEQFKQGLKLIGDVGRIGFGQSGNADDLPRDLKAERKHCRSFSRSSSRDPGADSPYPRSANRMFACNRANLRLFL